MSGARLQLCSAGAVGVAIQPSATTQPTLTRSTRRLARRPRAADELYDKGSARDHIATSKSAGASPLKSRRHSVRRALRLPRSPTQAENSHDTTAVTTSAAVSGACQECSAVRLRPSPASDQTAQATNPAPTITNAQVGHVERSLV